MSHPLSRALKNGVSLRLGTFAFDVTVHSSVAEDTDIAMKTVCTGQHHVNQVIELATGAGKTATAAALAKAAHPVSTVRQTYTCPVCAAQSDFGKARPVGDGFIPIPDSVMEAADAAEAEFGKVLELKVHPAAEVGAAVIPSGKSYYLSVKTNTDLYAAIVGMIKASPDKAYVTQWAVRTAVSPFQLVVEGDNILTLRQLSEPTLVRARPKVEGVANPRELAAAIELAEALIEPFDVEAFDRPRARILAEFTEGKMPETPVLVPSAASADGGGGRVLSLLEALAAAKAKKKAPAKPAKKSSTTKKAPASARVSA